MQIQFEVEDINICTFPENPEIYVRQQGQEIIIENAGIYTVVEMKK